MMEPVLLHYFAFFLLLFFFFMFTVLDGFDLGIGAVAPWLRENEKRNALLSLIAPVWDGNEVWLVMGVGFLFGAFPGAFTVLLPAFYFPVFCVLLALILRAVSIEFSYHSSRYTHVWQRCISISSIVITIGGAWVIGQIVFGLPLIISPEGTVMIDHVNHDYFSPFPFIFALAVLPLILWHGCAYSLKKLGDLEYLKTVSRFRIAALAGFIIIALVLTLALPALRTPAVFAGLGISLAAIALGTTRAPGSGRPFIASSIAIAGIWIACAGAIIPDIIPAPGRHLPGLGIARAAAPRETLRFITLVTAGFLPVILLYTRFVYRIFSKNRKGSL